MIKVKKIWGEEFGKELEIDLVGKQIWQIYQDIKVELFFGIVLTSEPTSDEDYSLINVLGRDGNTRKYNVNVVYRAVLEVDITEHGFSVFELR
jgi:hypothetical protein